jgi:hypothetical protein
MFNNCKTDTDIAPSGVIRKRNNINSSVIIMQSKNQDDGIPPKVPTTPSTLFPPLEAASVLTL